MIYICFIQVNYKYKARFIPAFQKQDLSMISRTLDERLPIRYREIEEKRQNWRKMFIFCKGKKRKGLRRTARLGG